MVSLEGKVICNAILECDDLECNHRIPHEHTITCGWTCDSDSGGVPGGSCVPIQVYCRVNGNRVYYIKGIDGKTGMIPKNPSSEIPEFYMDEKIYICPSHAICPYDNCNHKVFHNKLDKCETECHRIGIPLAYCGITCREANSDEILQLFRDHEGENQHIDDMLKEDDKAYSELMEELTKQIPENPKPVHERVKRFLNLEI